MKKIQVALLGLGTVGKGIYYNLKSHQKRIEDKFGISIEIATIVVKHPEKHQNFEDHSLITSDFRVVLDNPNISVIFEAINDREPAFTYLKKSIQAGKHVITANKEMFAHHGKELVKLAEMYRVHVGFEATTAGGIPIIQTIKQLLQVNRITKLTAILNGTTNYILTEMRENQLSFQKALEQAQQLGYAEADPTNDVEGYDAFYKLMILSQLLYNQQPDWNAVIRKGITEVTIEDIATHDLQNERFKHIATIEISNDHIIARVEPQVVPTSHPLYSIEGVNNAILLEGDIVGSITLSGPGAGSFPTASAMIEDLAIILRSELKWGSKPILI